MGYSEYQLAAIVAEWRKSHLSTPLLEPVKSTEVQKTELLTRIEAINKLAKVPGNFTTHFLDALEALGLIKFREEKAKDRILPEAVVENWLDNRWPGNLTNEFKQLMAINGFKIVKV